MRKPLKEARPPLLEDRKAKMKRARSPSITSSPIPQLDGTYAPSTLKTNLLSRIEDTESAPKHEPDPESAPEPEPETEAGPESETELEIELKPIQL